MPRKIRKPLNQNIIDQWPEIFSDVNLSTVPILYLDSVVITFKDGNQWEVKLKKEDKENVDGGIPKTLQELFENYEQSIQFVDFRLDIEKIKKDITKTTKKYLKRK